MVNLSIISVFAFWKFCLHSTQNDEGKIIAYVNYTLTKKSESCEHAHLYFIYKQHTKYESCSIRTVGEDSRTYHVSISARINGQTDEQG